MSHDAVTERVQDRAPKTAADLGIMEGFPPPPERRVNLANWAEAPFNRWAFLHVRELVPTALVSRGSGAVRELPPRHIDTGALERLELAGGDGEATTVGALIIRSYTDALVVLQEGDLVYEHYHNGMAAGTHHMLASVTKSFTGLLGAMLIDEAVLQREEQVSLYLPELASSAFGDATVGQVLDMVVAVDYDELEWFEGGGGTSDDADPPFVRFARAAGFSPISPTTDAHSGIPDFLPTLSKKGEHSRRFIYCTPATEVIGWLIARSARKPYARLLSERIWSRIGAEADAHIGLDRIGTPVSGGGLNATCRDLARFGQMLLDDGCVDDVRVVSPNVIADISRGGDKAAFAADPSCAHMAGWSYRNQWWVAHDDESTFSAWGVCGQLLWIDPTNRVVIAKMSTYPETVSPARDLDEFALCRGVARHVATT